MYLPNKQVKKLRQKFFALVEQQTLVVVLLAVMKKLAGSHDFFV